MIYVLDTDILVLFQEGHSAVCQRVLGHGIDELATTVITVEEQLSGWYTLLRRAKGPSQLAHAYHRLASSIQLLSRFQILSFTEPSIARFEQLKGLKLGVKHMDLRIAAIALEHVGTLVTRNTMDFQSVPELMIEDWSV
ncbi:MAG: type II toxin-antitoxin system VapC family toxin [Planctomycetota bacterium]